MGPGRALRRALGLLLPAVLATAGGTARADEIDVGRQKAQVCAVCHGVIGISIQPDAPSLAGQPAPYLVAQLRAFRSGARKQEVMTVMAKVLTDDDIAALAAWFSAIKVEATSPR